jgi:sulfite reductase (NADPH) hemoprotein beta-component
MPVPPSIASVARIAYLASDIVVDSQPALLAASHFAETFESLSKTPSSHIPTLISLPARADPGFTLLHNNSAALVSFTSIANSQGLTRLALHLADLSSTSLVLHVAVKDDLSDVLILRSAVPFFLISSTVQQAHDNALLASRLARTERKAVIHVFYTGQDEEIVEVTAEKIRPFLQAASITTSSGSDVSLTDLLKTYESAALSTLSLVRRALRPLTVCGSAKPHIVIFLMGHVHFAFDVEDVSFVFISLFNPLPHTRILNAIPSSTTHVIILEQIYKWSMTWTPLYLEVVSAVQHLDSDRRPHVRSGTLGDSSQVSAADVVELIRQATSLPPTVRLHLGKESPSSLLTSNIPHVPKHESSYTKILSHIFADRLEISNSPSLVLSKGEIATSPEFALGWVRGQLDHRADLIRSVQDLLEADLDASLHSLLSQWILAKDDGVNSKKLGKEIVEMLEAADVMHPAAEHVLTLRAHFPALSRWIIGSDAWSYDLGSSGLHHAIASGLNVNVLILDTLPYSARNSADPNRRKHDVGLYAMNYGDVYVASVAVYSSYSQVLQSLIEADQFKGPSVVLAYLPYQAEDCPALNVLKETKTAVDAGYWPLYRWNPSKEREGKEPFSLDSDAIKNDLQQFLDRKNHLSQLVHSTPQMAAEIVSSLGETVKEARRRRAQQSYDELLSHIDAPPLLVLYASDGGSAEKVAKRLANRGKARGLLTSVATIDSMSLDNLAQEEYAVFVTSVAGQGEPPQNGRSFFKTINAVAARGDMPLSGLRFSVFGMGDSHYWPRPEDAHYYNKPGKDLNTRLEQLGGQRIADLGLGDDQDADGPATGYKIWEPLLWKALGVDSIEVTEVEPEPITNEHIKAASQYLRGTIAEGLVDTTTGALAPSDGQLTKFHGIYQQDDRDIRDERQAQGVAPAYSFMIRVRMPGGVCQSDQWLQMDQIADEHGSGTFKITTRQTFQFHGVIKAHLKPAIQDINKVLLDTLAACGDVNRLVCIYFQRNLRLLTHK